MADPFRLYGMRRENNQEPVAARQSFPNLVVLLLRPNNMLGTVPVFDAVLLEQFDEFSKKPEILVGVRNENLSRTRFPEPLIGERSLAPQERVPQGVRPSSIPEGRRQSSLPAV